MDCSDDRTVHTDDGTVVHAVNLASTAEYEIRTVTVDRGGTNKYLSLLHGETNLFWAS